MTTDDLIMCKKCGGSSKWVEADKFKSFNAPGFYVAMVSCANPRCYMVVAGRHRRKRKAIQIAMQTWQERNEVES